MKNKKIPSDSPGENSSEKANAGREHLVQSKVSNSGNSDVNIDIKIDVDVKPIAFAILYSLFATHQLTEQGLEKALKRLESYTNNLTDVTADNSVTPKGGTDE